MKKIELLAPAGNYDSFIQAINNGADAIYMAGKNFNARTFAQNFTNEEMKAFNENKISLLSNESLSLKSSVKKSMIQIEMDEFDIASIIEELPSEDLIKVFNLSAFSEETTSVFPSTSVK